MSATIDVISDPAEPRPARRLFSVDEVDQPSGLHDQLHMLKAVAAHARWVGHRELLGQVRQHLRWHVQRVGQERAQPTHRRQLQGKTQPVVRPTALGDQFLVGVVEEEGPFQVGPRGCAGVLAEDPSVVIREELDRHGPIGYDLLARAARPLA
jgi:hypothetical protein